MSDIVIKTTKISKRYNLGLTGHQDLRSAMSAGVSQLLMRKEKQQTKKDHEFWALKDISFEVRRGESIGIIGKNGAGKSTLLKIFSKITPPTTGRIEMDGRVASLLEVGTGFHQELTGRENIFLNGSILGMTKDEIKRKFDEIVAFSGVESFLDIPIKRYSSGMAVRLAFSVAAHLDAEILLIDEVLSVGDLAFQKKCIGKMDEIAGSGRTIIFVSHNMRTIQQLCTRGILLDQGKILIEGDMEKVIQYYVEQYSDLKSAQVTFEMKERKIANIFEISLHNSKKEMTNQFQFGEPFSITFKVKTRRNVRLMPIVGIDTNDGIRVGMARGADLDFELITSAGDVNEINILFDKLTLTPGKYRVLVRIVEGKGHVIDQQKNAIGFEIMEISYKNTRPFSGKVGIIRPTPKWSNTSMK